MDLPRDDVDPGGLLEYSVVFTDRSLNHMSQRFVAIMQEAIGILRTTYAADTVALVPGGGTYGMEAVARQLMTGKRVVVVRNGFFSYRWSQILDQGGIAESVTVCRAQPVSGDARSAWAPPPVQEVVETIRRERPTVVCAAHVETASGILLPDDYVRAVADAAHEVGGFMVLDCIASGALWVDMRDLGVDILLTAPQKGWSGTPCVGYVLLNSAAGAAVRASTSTSFAADLRRWLEITEGYAAGAAAYHATMPTDGIAHNVGLMRKTVETGLEVLRSAQVELGARVRTLLHDEGFPSVAADGFASPSVVVVHTDDPDLRSGAAFKPVGLQVAAGVPLMCGEPESWSTFRLGLFGLDKLTDVDGAVGRFGMGLERLGR
jgi:aspartate aminotransferase-like enzyme